MKNENNSDPYSSLNGQGMFGIDSSNWFKGAPLSGISTLAHVIGAKFEQRFSKELTLYQKITVEAVMPSREKHEAALEVGVEGGY
jgi:hypothetical protein